LVGRNAQEILVESFFCFHQVVWLKVERHTGGEGIFVLLRPTTHNFWKEKSTMIPVVSKTSTTGIVLWYWYWYLAWYGLTC
jgi:hypothetical protein